MVSLVYYLVSLTDPAIAKMPLWKPDGAIVTFLLHVGPIEFLYYWLHRALHHHYLYSRYHSHHHSSIVTEPITCKIVQHYYAHVVSIRVKFYQQEIAYGLSIKLTAISLVKFQIYHSRIQSLKFATFHTKLQIFGDKFEIMLVYDKLKK